MEQLLQSIIQKRFGYLEGEPDRVLPPDLEEVQQYPAYVYRPVVSLVCALVALAAFQPFQTFVALPFIGRAWTFGIAGIALWHGVFQATAWSARRYPSSSFGHLVKMMNRSTGLGWVNTAGEALCGSAVLLLLFTAPAYSPFAYYGLQAFRTFSAVKPEEWPTWPVSRTDLPLPEDLPADFEGDDAVLVQTFQWTAALGPEQSNRYFSLRLAIDRNRYAEFQQKNPFAIDGYPEAVEKMGVAQLIRELVGRGQTPEVLQVAAHLRRFTEQLRLNPFDEVNNTLAFAQGIGYKPDPGQDYWRYPIETMMEHEGDCDCLAILAAALLRALGHRCLILLTRPGVQNGHMALAVAGADGFPQSQRFYTSTGTGGRAFFYCEPTASSWTAGEMPPQYSLSDFIEVAIET